MKKTRISHNYLLFIIVFVSLTFGLNAANPGATKSIFDLMTYKEVMEVTIESDFENLKYDRRNEEYQVAKMTFKDETGTVQNWDAKVKIRGKFRRMNCSDIPPLKIKFKKSELEAAGLARFNDMKLVTQCIADKYLAQELVKKEYAAYRLYNEVTENSFRVQLLKITYVDSNTGEKRKEFGFFIEDTAQLTSRLNLGKCEECLGQPFESFDTDAIRLASVFQYMIGNSDWNIMHGRNIKIMHKGDKLIAIPYDFDFSGLVNAPYAVPSSAHGIPNVRARIYLGFEEDTAGLYNTLYSIYGNRIQLKSIIGDMKFLSREARSEMRDYLDEFFEDFENIQSGEKAIADTVNTLSED